MQMKIKHLYIALFALMAMASCTKEADMNMAEEKNLAPAKNAYRAILIEGHNDIWGDYIFRINYENDRLKNAVRVTLEGDTVGSIVSSRASDIKYTYEVRDIVPIVDEDSIARLDQQLKDKYGEGNYSLKDSIPRGTQIRYNIVVELYKDGRVSRQTVTYSIPPIEKYINGKFNYKYLMKERENLLYEYDNNGRVVACRVFKDVYDLKDQEKSTRTIYKETYAYNGDKVSTIIQYGAEAGESFNEKNRFDATYSGNNLTALKGTTGGDYLFGWSGSSLNSITLPDNTKRTYTWNANGFVETISDDGVGTMKITYEEGNGNLSWLSIMKEGLYGLPIIK